MTGTASRLETRAAIRSRVRDQSDIDRLSEYVGVLMRLAAVALAGVVATIVARVLGLS